MIIIVDYPRSEIAVDSIGRVRCYDLIARNLQPCNFRGVRLTSFIGRSIDSWHTG